jgi:hypothetical protein
MCRWIVYYIYRHISYILSFGFIHECGVQESLFHSFCWVLKDSTSKNKYLTLQILDASWFVLSRATNRRQNG